MSGSKEKSCVKSGGEVVNTTRSQKDQYFSHTRLFVCTLHEAQHDEKTHTRNAAEPDFSCTTLYLPDDGVSGGDGNLNGAFSHWQEEVLNSLLY